MVGSGVSHSVNRNKNTLSVGIIIIRLGSCHISSLGDIPGATSKTELDHRCRLGTAHDLAQWPL